MAKKRHSVFSYIGEYKPLFILAPFLTVLESVAELILPFLMGKIVDNGIDKNDTGYMITMGIVMVVIALAGMAIGILGAKVSSTAAQGFGYNLRRAMFSQIQTFSFADIDQFSTPSLVTRCTLDVRQIQEVTMQIVRMLVRAPALMFVSLGICLNLHAGLSIVYWVAIPILLAIIVFIMHITRRFFSIMQKKCDALNASVRENMIAIRVVKTLVRAAFEKKKFKDANDDLTNTTISASLRIALLHPCSTVIFNLATIALYWFGGHLVGDSQMQEGSLLTYISYLNNILMSVMMFNMVLTRLSRARACIDRCTEIISHESSIQQPDAPVICEKSQGHIVFDHVDFAYPRTGRGLVLKDICIDILPGEFIAMVGKTGVGKSTFANLIPRFYDPTNGAIYIDDIDLRHRDIEELRREIGIVPQQNLLFTGSVRENLMWGNESATEDELLDALRDAQAYDFVMAMPQGLDTQIVQGGTNVSGGQRQRLCIARAMLKKPKILILDDSTSALDSNTEAKIRDLFYEKYSHITTLLIAQRISSVQSADRIIVLDQGRISAVGTHQELLETSPVYKAIYDSQQEGGGR